jgi:hypothetical protein
MKFDPAQTPKKAAAAGALQRPDAHTFCGILADSGFSRALARFQHSAIQMLGANE